MSIKDIPFISKKTMRMIKEKITHLGDRRLMNVS